MLNQIRDAISNDARLPAPRASQYEYRPFGGFDSLALLRIELFKKRQFEEMAPSPMCLFYVNVTDFTESIVQEIGRTRPTGVPHVSPHLRDIGLTTRKSHEYEFLHEPIHPISLPSRPSKTQRIP